MNIPPIDIFAHLLGVISLFVFFYSLTIKDDRKLMNYMILSIAFIVPHLFLLGSTVSAFCAFIGGVRVYVAKKSKHVGFLLGFLLFALAQAVFFTNSAYELIPIMSFVVMTVGYFKFSGIPLRACLCIGSLLWVIDSIVVGSVSHLVMNGVAIFIHLTTMARIRSDKLKECHEAA